MLSMTMYMSFLLLYYMFLNVRDAVIFVSVFIISVNIYCINQTVQPNNTIVSMYRLIFRTSHLCD